MMNLFIACSSSDDMPLDTLEMSGSAIQSLATSGNYDLVIGGNSGGLMQFCYNAFHDQKRMITSIVDSKYQNDLRTMDCDLSIITEDTFDRSRQIMLQADALLFMPGGIGTMAEFFGMLEEKRTHEMDKPIILYNEDRSFDPLLRLMDRIYKDGYANEKERQNYHVVYDQAQLFECLESYQKKSSSEVKNVR